MEDPLFPPRLPEMDIPDGATINISVPLDRMKNSKEANEIGDAIEVLLTERGFSDIRVDVELLRIMDEGAPIYNWKPDQEGQSRPTRIVENTPLVGWADRPGFHSK